MGCIQQWKEDPGLKSPALRFPGLEAALWWEEDAGLKSTPVSAGRLKLLTLWQNYDSIGKIIWYL